MAKLKERIVRSVDDLGLPKVPLNQGGVAWIYKIGNRVLKLYKRPEEFEDPKAQEAARRRLEEFPKKLQLMHGRLPKGVVQPETVVYTRTCLSAKIEPIGFFMPEVTDPTTDTGSPYMLSDYLGEPLRYRVCGSILIQLIDALSALHKEGITYGDLNPRNVFLERVQLALEENSSNVRVHVLDIDAACVGQFQTCDGWTDEWTDPNVLRLDSHRVWFLLAPRSWGNKLPELRFCGRYSPETDWYAFYALALAMLTGLGPFGGAIPGVNPQRRVAGRKTIFHRDVVLPPEAVVQQLPKPFKELFDRVFVRGDRPIPDRKLFEALAGRRK